MYPLIRTVPAVVVGGAVGTLARLGVFELGERLGWSAWAFLLVVNLSGAFALGWFATHAGERRSHPVLVAFVAAGILGSFTTFSGFTVEAVEGIRAGDGVTAAAFVVGSLGAGVAAALAGRIAAQRR